MLAPAGQRALRRIRASSALLVLSLFLPSVAAAAAEPPPARLGFQMHFVPLTAVSFPFGDASGAPGDELSARYGWQWMPLELGLGAKLFQHLYLGGYFNFGIGAEGDDMAVEARCEKGDDVVDDVSCSAASVRAGVELRFTFAPAAGMSGWAGYGIGFTSATQYISDEGRYRESTTASGAEWARLSGGLDFRVKRGFGLGPFVSASIGRFARTRTEIQSSRTFSGDIADRGFHAWLSGGLRMVIFP